MRFKIVTVNIFKISEAELERRKEFDRNMKVSKEGLEEMKRLKPEAATDIDAKLGSTIKKQEKDEQKRRDNQQTNIFKKGFEFIGNKFEDISQESWGKNIDLQLNSVFKCCQTVLKTMSKQQNGCIVNISSIYGSLAPDFSVYDDTEMTMPAAYSVIKSGVNNFTRYLASYYGSKGIRVNSVSPGGVFDNQNKTFVENYIHVLPILKKNISNLNYQDSSLIIEDNIFDNLNFNNFSKKFDIIFMDPPYKEKNLSSILINIAKSNILNEEGIIVIHRHKNEKDKFPEKFNIIEEKTYGISRIIYGNFF